MTSMSVTTSHCRTIQAGAVRVPTSGPYPGTDHYWQTRAALPDGKSLEGIAPLSVIAQPAEAIFRADGPAESAGEQ